MLGFETSNTCIVICPIVRVVRYFLRCVPVPTAIVAALNLCDRGPNASGTRSPHCGYHNGPLPMRYLETTPSIERSSAGPRFCGGSSVYLYRRART